MMIIGELRDNRGENVCEFWGDVDAPPNPNWLIGI